MPWPRLLALATALLAVVMAGGGCALLFLEPRLTGGDAAIFLSWVAAGAISVVLGLFVSARRPTNVVGALLTLTGLAPVLIGLSDLFDTVNLVRPAPLPWGEAVHQLTAGSWTFLYVPIMLLGLLFPDGRTPPGRFPRVVLYGVLFYPLYFDVVAATDPSPFPAPFEGFDHPLPTAPEWFGGFAVASALGMMVLLVCTALVMRRRYRAAGPVERAQVKWFALSSVMLPGTLLLCWCDYLLFGEIGHLIMVGLAALYLGVPFLTTLAMLRHDLYDVDRTATALVTWGLVTTGLLAVYSGASFTGGLLVGRNSAVTVAAATALVAVVLVPAKNRVGAIVDRRFYPVRQRALAAVDALERQVHAGRARPEQLEEVLRDALHDPRLRVGYLLPGGSEFRDAAGTAVTAGTEVRLAGHPVGVVDGRCPREVATACALLVETVRLRLELRQALGEAEASRRRMLRAGYRERRRLERDLHDGAQSRLVTLGMSLRLAQRHLADGSVDVNGLLDQAVAELGTAVAELRELAHGLRPSSLDDGLAPALEALTMRAPVRLNWHLDGRDLPDDIATTAYFVANEAVTNAIKHSQTTIISILVTEDGDGALRLTVEDDGPGGAAPQAGTGLSGLIDRVTAHGGRLNIASPPGGGTTVEAILPCAS